MTPSAETREALWRDAGLVRDAEGLRRLLDDPSPLARLIATCALQREESRGAHARSDFPDLDESLQVNLVWGTGTGVSREPIPPVPDEIAGLMREVSTVGKLVE